MTPAVQPPPTKPSAISTLRFVVYIGLVTTACIAWYERRFAISTPLLAMCGVLLYPKAELLSPVRGKHLLLGVTVAVVAITATGFLIQYAAPWVSSVVTEEQFDAIGVHPVTIASGWLLMVYAGAARWRRQLEARAARVDAPGA